MSVTLCPLCNAVYMQNSHESPNTWCVEGKKEVKRKVIKKYRYIRKRTDLIPVLPIPLYHHDNSFFLIIILLNSLFKFLLYWWRMLGITSVYVGMWNLILIYVRSKIQCVRSHLQRVSVKYDMVCVCVVWSGSTGCDLGVISELKRWDRKSRRNIG